MLDANGSLLFTYTKCGTTGILLLEEQINLWITCRTAKRKKADQEDAISIEQEEIIARMLQLQDKEEDKDDTN
jgi:accessory colonization factor AcfC